MNTGSMNPKKTVSFAQDIIVLRCTPNKKPKWWQFWKRYEERYKYNIGFVTANHTIMEGDLFMFESRLDLFVVSKIGLVKNSYNQVEVLASSVVYIEEIDRFRPQNIYIVSHSMKE